jgi:hypothetical protein
MWNPITEMIIQLVQVEEGLDRLQKIVDESSAPKSAELLSALLEATAHLLKMGRTVEATFTATVWVELIRRAK